MILRHAPRHVLFSRQHSSSPPLWRSSPGSAWWSGLPSLLVERLEDHRVLGNSLSFQVRGITVVPPGGCVPPFGARTSSIAALVSKVIGTGGRGLLGVSRDTSQCYHFHFCPLIPGPVDPGYERNTTMYWTQIQGEYNFLEYLSSALWGITS